MKDVEQLIRLRPDWTNRRAFVVGGGPSLIGFDWETLRNERVIAVNRACETVPWADVLFSMDTRFFNWFLENVKDFEGQIVHHRGSEAQVPSELIDRVIEVDVAGERVITEDLMEGLGSGANSGYGAMNLALALGASPVYLLGFDLNPTQEYKQQWWHDGYPMNDCRPWAQYRANFDYAGRNLIPEGRVLNASVTSSIRGFPIVASWPRRACSPKPDLPYVVVSYFTDMYYREKAERMAASAEIHGLKVWMYDRPDLGNWVRNCGQKPQVILSAMKLFPNQDILWVDADALFRAYPTDMDDFHGVCDLAVRYRGGQVLSGTIYLANNSRVRRFVEEWITEQGKSRTKWDQQTLQTVMTRRRDLRVMRLPEKFCFIFDLDKKGRDRTGEAPMPLPVIEHFQASRRVKAKERMRS